MNKLSKYAGRGRNPQLQQLRNRAIAARFYYYTELQRRRYDDVMWIMVHHEFFFTEQVISNALKDEDGYLCQLMKDKPTAVKLSHQYPAFNWTKNATIAVAL